MKIEDVNKTLLGKAVIINQHLDTVTCFNGIKLSGWEKNFLQQGELIISERHGNIIDGDDDLFITDKNGNFVFVHYSFVELKNSETEIENGKQALQKFLDGENVEVRSSSGNWFPLTEFHLKYILSGNVEFRVKKEPAITLGDKEYTNNSY